MNDIFDSLVTSGTSLLTGLQKIAPIGLALCVLGSGFLFITGRKGADTAKGWLPYILFGGVLIFGAISVASWVQTTSTF